MDNYVDDNEVERCHNFIGNGVKNIYLILKPFIKFMFTIFAVSFMHWVLVRIMSSYCSPPGFLGPFVNMVTMGSPICQSINNLQLNLTNYYIIVLGTAMTMLCNWIYNFFDIKKN